MHAHRLERVPGALPCVAGRVLQVACKSQGLAHAGLSICYRNCSWLYVAHIIPYVSACCSRDRLKCGFNYLQMFHRQRNSKRQHPTERLSPLQIGPCSQCCSVNWSLEPAEAVLHSPCSRGTLCTLNTGWRCPETTPGLVTACSSAPTTRKSWRGTKAGERKRVCWVYSCTRTRETDFAEVSRHCHLCALTLLHVTHSR